MFSFRRRRKVPEDAGVLGGKLSRTRSRFGAGLLRLFSSGAIDADVLDDLEADLITADVGVEVTTRIIAALRDLVSRRDAGDAEAVRAHLRQLLVDILAPVSQPLEISDVRPFVILVTGVNGVGKTTTIGKLAQQLSKAGLSVMLAAGDTFRAAAAEQLQQWADRLEVPLVRQASGADAASVIFDALQSARSRGVDVLIADTAGRLHTQAGLMDELGKVKRVLAKLDETAPHETLMVVDGGTGQNAISQVRQFNQAVGVSGLVITKLDGTAKGGVVFALAETFAIPVRFIGVGETADDLRSFDGAEFVDALLTE